MRIAAKKSDPQMGPDGRRLKKGAGAAGVKAEPVAEVRPYAQAKHDFEERFGADTLAPGRPRRVKVCVGLFPSPTTLRYAGSAKVNTGAYRVVVAVGNGHQDESAEFDLVDLADALLPVVRRRKAADQQAFERMVDRVIAEGECKPRRKAVARG